MGSRSTSSGRKTPATAETPEAPKAAARPRRTSARKKPVSAGPPAISSGERERYIAEAAYYIAEQRGFASGSEVDDWIRAEAEIDRLLESIGSKH